MIQSIWFWQTCVTPHMVPLVNALYDLGCDVVYVGNVDNTSDREEMGWNAKLHPKVVKIIAEDEAEVRIVVGKSSKDAIHICQGLRGNGLVGYAEDCLSERGMKYWVVMETVDLTDWRRMAKELVYRYILWKSRKRINGMLAIGYRNVDWLTRIVPRGINVHPFAYFLEEPEYENLIYQKNISNKRHNFRFLFVGRFIPVKNLEELFKALSMLERNDFELFIVGDGPMGDVYRKIGDELLPDKIHWLGVKKIDEVSSIMAESDCLVLTSRADGWGAVVSESMMVGTPVICSDNCGSAGVVYASGHGAVYRSGDVHGLRTVLSRELEKGRSDKRKRMALASWAKCLGARCGAKYIKEILEFESGIHSMPTPPWFSVIL